MFGKTKIYAELISPSWRGLGGGKQIDIKDTHFY
jgi:hypothetical protein